MATFIRLDETNPKAARDSYNIAQPALVKAKKYDLCGKYLEPEKSYAMFERVYRFGLKYAEERKTPALPKDMLLEDAKESFLYDSATLIALLVLNDRKPDAEKIATDARILLQDPKRDPVINAALNGKPPKSRYGRPEEGDTVKNQKP